MESSGRGVAHRQVAARCTATPGLEKMMVTQRGSRLSVQPVTRGEYQIVARLGRDTSVLVNLSGRGDKDVAEVLRVTGRGGA